MNKKRGAAALAILAIVLVPAFVLASVMGSTLVVMSIGAGSASKQTVACQAVTAPIQLGTAPAGNDLFEAIKSATAGSNRLAFAMLMGTHLESGWDLKAIGQGSYGPYQIQDPGVVHPDMTIAMAFDPVASTNYMLPEYRRALAKVSDAQWQSSPVTAAELVIYGAERPKYIYHQSRGQATVDRSYAMAISKMRDLGISTDFGSGTAALPSNDIPLPPGVDNPTGCATVPTVPIAGTFADPGPGPQNPNLTGLYYNLRPRTVNMINFGKATWGCESIKPPCVVGYNGWRPKDVAPDHPGGYATDFMISKVLGQYPTAEQTVFGWTVACYLQAHASELGVQYVIWQGKIFNVSRADEGGGGGCQGVTVGWRDYSCGPYGEQCTLTEGHYDHLHITERLN